MRNSGARSGRYANAEVTIDANPFDGHVTSRAGTQCWTRTDATAPPFIKSVPPCVQRTRGGQLHVLERGQSTQPNNGQLTIHRSMIRRSNGNRSFGGTSYLFFFLITDRPLYQCAGYWNSIYPNSFVRRTICTTFTYDLLFKR